METFSNDYRKEEDSVLWELHEIRHELSIEYATMTSEEINSRARALLQEFKNKNASFATKGNNAEGYGNSNI